MPNQTHLPTPFYAAVGAGDALVAKVRASDPSQLKAPKLKTPHVKAPQLSDVKEIPAHLKALPEHLHELQEQAQTFATDTLGQLSTAYTDFAKRGESVVKVARKRGESVVDDARLREVVADVKDAVSKLQGVARPGTTATEEQAADASEAKKPADDATSAEPKPAAASTAKKPAAKKSTTTKSTTTKTTAKKPAAKKPTAKKSTTEKDATRKSDSDTSE